MVQPFSQNVELTKDFGWKYLTLAFNLPNEFLVGIQALDNLTKKTFSFYFFHHQNFLHMLVLFFFEASH